MRILCLQQSSIFENYGGIEYYLHDFLTLTSQILGSESVLSLIPQRQPNFESASTTYQVRPVPYPGSSLLKKVENRIPTLLFTSAIESAQTFKPDIILVGHVSLAPLAQALSLRLKIPFWTIAYGLEVWGSAGFITDWAFRKSQKIISISHWTKNILVARGFPASSIEIVHPALQPVFHQKTPKPFSLEAEKPLKLLTVSRLDPHEQYKGHDHVLEAMSKIKKEKPDVLPNYTIQGRGLDKERLERLVFFHGLQDHVRFLDKLSTREELENLYRECDLFVMPSRFGCWNGRWRGEGFGIVYVEAAALGIPSVAYNCGGVTDIIESGMNGILVEPDNVKALADTFIQLHQDRVQLKTLGLKARETALRNFSQETIRTQIAQVLASGQSIPEVRPNANPVDVSDVLDSLS